MEFKQENNNRESKTTIVIIESKNIQNAVTAKEKEYDTGKKFRIKLHIGINILGLSHIIFLTTTKVTNRTLKRYEITS